MSLRGRFLLVSLLVGLIPMFALSFGLRRESSRQLQELYLEQVSRLESNARLEMAKDAERIDRALSALRDEMLADNRFRSSLAAAADQIEDRRYQIDLGERLMQPTGLDLLEVLDSQGLVVTSGHFREQFGEPGTAWPASTDRPLFAEVAFPEAPSWVRIRILSFEIAGSPYVIVGGTRTRWQHGDRGVPSREDPISIRPLDSEGVSLLPGEIPAGSDEPVWLRRDVPVRLFRGRPPRVEDGVLAICASGSRLDARLDRLDRWFLAAAAGALALAVVLAWTSAGALSRPLRSLADKTTQVRIGRRYVDFRSQRSDEVGDLSRFVGAMVDRLQGSVEQLKEAERTATVGEIARQVHHDIRNGLTPIRNVMRHLGEVAAESPDRLAEIFRQRSATVDAGLEYLDELSSNYARLTPEQTRERLDLNEVVRAVTDPLSHGRHEVRVSLGTGPMSMLGDPVGVRRIVENLVRNALESLQPADRPESGSIDATEGWVEVKTMRSAESIGLPESQLRTAEVALIVQDSGAGMDESTQARIFEHFYSTKSSGVGLGLGIVKRLVADFGGRLDLESSPGRGTRFRVFFPDVDSAKERKVGV